MTNINNQDNQKFIIKIALIASLTAIVLIAILRDRIVNYPRREISVTGQGKIFVKPDIAQITLALNVFKKPTPAEALKEASEKTQKIIAKISELGVEAKDIQTANFNLNPEHEFTQGINRVAGFNLNQQLKIKVRNLDNTGKIIEAGVSEGSNQVGDVQFIVDDMEKAKQEARLEAVLKAKQKAQGMAKATGIKLGKVVGFWENIIPPSDFYPLGIGGMGGEATIKTAPPVPTGQNEIIVEVSLSYEVK